MVKEQMNILEQKKEEQDHSSQEQINESKGMVGISPEQHVYVATQKKEQIAAVQGRGKHMLSQGRIGTKQEKVLRVQSETEVSDAIGKEEELEDNEDDYVNRTNVIGKRQSSVIQVATQRKKSGGKDEKNKQLLDEKSKQARTSITDSRKRKAVEVESVPQSIGSKYRVSKMIKSVDSESEPEFDDIPVPNKKRATPSGDEGTRKSLAGASKSTASKRLSVGTPNPFQQDAFKDVDMEEVESSEDEQFETEELALQEDPQHQELDFTKFEDPDFDHLESNYSSVFNRSGSQVNLELLPDVDEEALANHQRYSITSTPIDYAHDEEGKSEFYSAPKLPFSSTSLYSNLLNSVSEPKLESQKEQHVAGLRKDLRHRQSTGPKKFVKIDDKSSKSWNWRWIFAIIGAVLVCALVGVYFFKPLKYCDTNDVSDDCIPCPIQRQFGHIEGCHNGIIECETGFILIRDWFDSRCELAGKHAVLRGIHRIAVEVLSKERGAESCGLEATTSSMNVSDLAVAIKEWVKARMHFTPDDALVNRSIELLQANNDVEVVEGKVFANGLIFESWSCYFYYILQLHWAKFLLVGIVLIFVIYVYLHFLRKEIKEISIVLADEAKFKIWKAEPGTVSLRELTQHLKDVFPLKHYFVDQREWEDLVLRDAYVFITKDVNDSLDSRLSWHGPIYKREFYHAKAE